MVQPANIVYGTALSGTQLDATASVPGTFSYTPAAGTVLGAGNNQTLSVAFTPTDTTDYTTATATATINVLQATPTISWAKPAAIVYGTALSATQLDATASVAGTFTYTPAAGTVLSAGNNQTLSVDLHADRHDRLHHRHRNGDDQRLAGDADDQLGQSGGHRLRHGPERNPARRHGQRGGNVHLHAGRGHHPGAGNNQTLSVAFTPTDTTDYTTATATATINVLQATPTITWAKPADIVYGTALSATQLDATASVPGTFTYTPAAGTVLGAGNNQTLSVAFTPTDTTDYTTATATATINVLPATPTITWANPANIVYGTALSATQLDATASVPGTFTYTPAAGTVLAPATTRRCRSPSRPPTRPTTPLPPQRRRSTSCQRRRRSPGPSRRTSSTARP